MDKGDSIRKNDTKEKRETGDNLLNGWDVFKSLWIRCDTSELNKINRKLLECELSYVLPCGAIFWIIFLLFGK